MVESLEVGQRVKLILDKERSVDNKWHGKTGIVTKMTADAAGEVTGNPMDSLMIEVELDDGTVPDVHFRYDDVVPVKSEEQK